MAERTVAVILAAGKGTRMRSTQPKVLHTILDRPLIGYPLALSDQVGIDKKVVVVGEAREAVEACVRQMDPSAHFALQAEARGTADAVRAALDETDGFDAVLILSGDVPGLTAYTVNRLLQAYQQSDSPMVVLGFWPDDPTGYGRLITEHDKVSRIVEERDATDDERAVGLVNAGIYVANRAFLAASLNQITTENAQGEFYLTDLALLAAVDGTPAPVIVSDDPMEVQGINDRVELAIATAFIQANRNASLCESGVTMLDPMTTSVGWQVSLDQDVTLAANVTLHGNTRIGSHSTVGQGAVLTNVSVGNGVVIKPYCVVTDSTLEDGATIGPFAHLRPGTVLKTNAKVGNFVETKKAIVGPGSKASHLTYLGDCELGEGVNVGAGTITCNYDGKNKHKTIMEDGVFVGSNTAIVAPATIGKNAVIAAGTTITEDVPEDALALSRTPQSHVDGWAKRKRNKDETAK